MTKTIRKPAVKENLRDEWLRRHDDGENLADIAKKDGFDIRTVRRQVEQGIAERELADARQSILKEALREHFADFVSLAKNMREQVEKGVAVYLDDAQKQLLEGLKKHLPRSSIFSYLKKWDIAVGEERTAKDALIKRLHQVTGIEPDLAGIAERVATQMASELLTPRKQGQRGEHRTSFVSRPTFQPTASGTIAVTLDNRPMGEIPAGSEERLLALVSTMEGDIRDWDEFKRFGKLLAANRRLKKKFQTELLTLQLKRVVPGRCPYCPI